MAARQSCSDGTNGNRKKGKVDIRAGRLAGRERNRIEGSSLPSVLCILSRNTSLS